MTPNTNSNCSLLKLLYFFFSVWSQSCLVTLVHWQIFENKIHNAPCLWSLSNCPCAVCFVRPVRTLHQRGSAVPGPSGQHGGGHSLCGGRSDQQLSSAPQLWQGDQREAEDVAFLSGEKQMELFSSKEIMYMLVLQSISFVCWVPNNVNLLRKAQGWEWVCKWWEEIWT